MAAKATTPLKDRQKAKKRKILAAMIDLEHAPSYCLFDSKWPLPFRKKGLSINYVIVKFCFLWIFLGLFCITKYVSHSHGILMCVLISISPYTY